MSLIGEIRLELNIFVAKWSCLDRRHDMKNEIEMVWICEETHGYFCVEISEVEYIWMLSGDVEVS